MLKTILFVLLPSLLLLSGGIDNSRTVLQSNEPQIESGLLQKMIVTEGSVKMNIDLGRSAEIRKSAKGSNNGELRFQIKEDSIFSILVMNDSLRGPLPGSMTLTPTKIAALPARLSASIQNLAIESTPYGGQYEMVVRDAATGFVFFNVEGIESEYSVTDRAYRINNGRLLLSNEFAVELGRANEGPITVGDISLEASMQPIEITQIENGEVKGESMPAVETQNAGTRPGPDVIVGDITGLQQFGSSGSRVGLAVGTTSCNYGTENLHWFQNPENDHPTIPQNLYRMSGGASNNDRFEQIGQSEVKHAFTALTQNICSLGCNGVGGANLGSGCSDPYSTSLNSGPNLGSKAWINPFTGFYPRNDGATPNNTHSGHSHDGTSHRVLTEAADLNTSLNSGATYFAEAQYVTPHEYAWCVTHPGQCNQYNNVSYRQYTVSGTSSFSFSPAGSTVREKPAIEAWTGATLVDIEPDPGNDGVGIVGYKVTNPSAGVWHYEYAIYNENLDRAIQSFGVPIGFGVTVTNFQFHAPPQHPGWFMDGTQGDAGFSSSPWTESSNGGFKVWGSETFAQNQNANAIRWGTMYNIRFDSNTPPILTTAMVGFFKTGQPIFVRVQAPGNPNVTCSRVPTGNRC